MTRTTKSDLAAAASFLGCLAAAAFLLYAPTVARLETTAAAWPGQVAPGPAASDMSLVRAGDADGTGPIILLPVLLALPGLMLGRNRYGRSVRIGAAFALLAFSVIAGFSIGLLYLPGAIIMAIAARITPGPRGSVEDGVTA